MKYAVFGTGIVGRTIAARLHELGHTVTIGTRDPARTLARSDPDGMGSPPFAAWQQDHQGISLQTYADAAAQAEIVVVATNGSGTLAALQAAGESSLDGKILIDITNPLDFSRGMPPTLTVCNDDSLAEQIQRAFPAARVVKTLNTMTAALMVHPELVGSGRTTVFVSGNDPAAKDQVSALLRSFGWQDILDLGDISTARGVEMYLPLWLRLWGALGTGMLNVRIER